MNDLPSRLAHIQPTLKQCSAKIWVTTPWHLLIQGLSGDGRDRRESHDYADYAGFALDEGYSKCKTTGDEKTGPGCRVRME